MKYILAFLLLTTTLFASSQVDSTCYDCKQDTIIKGDVTYMQKSAACGTPWLSTGNPPWTNYWAGFMLNIINNNACPITISSFEAEFGGNTGYRIYTKAGTFVGFEANAAAWTTVGTIGGGLSGLGAGVMTPIPIAVNVTIPPGGTQAFYLTRTNNTVANRHTYITGSGTPGTTVYASNADISITEAKYIDVYFINIAPTSTRRPSIDVCYTVDCALPIELISFEGEKLKDHNILTWESASESNNDYYTIEHSEDGYSWFPLGYVSGMGNSTQITQYTYRHSNPKSVLNYYRLKQTDFDGKFEYFDIVSVDNRTKPLVISKRVNLMGQDVDENYKGFVVIHYTNGDIIKTVQ